RLAWLRSRFARPVFDSLVLPLAGLFFVLSAQYGAVQSVTRREGRFFAATMLRCGCVRKKGMDL
ncbi:hypothetical protein, partial [Faecalibacterium sp. An192]|uniref:hypothetical protein n=1 Tax=Faecalibacterium sp. An192 TaxID=1965581 RepID=UPI0019D0A25F